MIPKRIAERLAPLQKLADACGVTIACEPTKNGHWRVVFEKDGATEVVILSGSPSDGRAIKNAEADGKRALRRKGWL
jgi:hypothetical protein